MSLKLRTQTLFRRYPLIWRLLMPIYRRTQPRFSAGVVGVLLNGEGRVLLVEHVFHNEFAWGLPGGWMGKGESPYQTIEREFREETGLIVRATIPLAIIGGHLWRNHLDFAYLMEPVGDPTAIQLCYELTDYGWFALDDLPPLKPFHVQALNLLKDRQILER